MKWGEKEKVDKNKTQKAFSAQRSKRVRMLLYSIKRGVGET